MCCSPPSARIRCCALLKPRLSCRAEIPWAAAATPLPAVACLFVTLVILLVTAHHVRKMRRLRRAREQEEEEQQRAQEAAAAGVRSRAPQCSHKPACTRGPASRQSLTAWLRPLVMQRLRCSSFGTCGSHHSWSTQTHPWPWHTAQQSGTTREPRLRTLSSRVRGACCRCGWVAVVRPRQAANAWCGRQAAATCHCPSSCPRPEPLL